MMDMTKLNLNLNPKRPEVYRAFEKQLTVLAAEPLDDPKRERERLVASFINFLTAVSCASFLTSGQRQEAVKLEKILSEKGCLSEAEIDRYNKLQLVYLEKGGCVGENFEIQPEEDEKN